MPKGIDLTAELQQLRFLQDLDRLHKEQMKMLEPLRYITNKRCTTRRKKWLKRNIQKRVDKLLLEGVRLTKVSTSYRTLQMQGFTGNITV